MIAYTFYEHDNRVRRYAETLVKRGDQVEVIALSGPFNVPPKEEICGVTVYRIQRREMKEKGIWSYAWPLIRFLFASSRFLAKLGRQGRYDLIHIHNMPDFLVFAAWHAKLRGAKLILDLHDLTPELFSSKFRIKPSSPVIGALKLIEKMSCRFVDHVIISNHIWSDVVEARSVRKDRCSVMINSVDSAIFYRRPRERKDSRFIIIFHGAYQWHQGLDIAIEAFALVKPELPNAELHFYGGGAKDMTDGLMELSKRLGLDGSVKFCGHTPFDSIPAIIANADLGVVPKRADTFGNEAYSTKIMEFMSQGVPVVLSKTKVDTFYFQEGAVHFFPSGDIRALATAILDVAKDDELRSGLISRGLEYVERNGWNTKKKEYLDLVDGI
jgi:glycosyltransferase involved in cell wall biosynthesis